MITYRISKKEIKKIPINSDTVNIVESLLESGKYTIPESLEETMYTFFDRYNIFYTVFRSKS